MTNTRLLFMSTTDGLETELECFANKSNDIVISITDTDCDHPWDNHYVSLDIPTAIKLSKVLRTEINKIKGI